MVEFFTKRYSDLAKEKICFLFCSHGAASYFYNDFSVDSSLVLGSQCFLYILKIRDFSACRNQFLLIQESKYLIDDLLGRIVGKEACKVYAVRDVLDRIESV